MSNKQSGFTLAELLIALALLGVIAAFTLPKIIQTSGNAENRAKVKEATATLEQAWYNLKSQNFITSGTTLYSNLTSPNAAAGLALNLSASGPQAANGAAVAATPGSAGPPVVPPTPAAGAGPLNGITHPCGGFTGWVLFPNGVVVAGLASGGNLQTPTATNAFTTTLPGISLICIDTNGATAPNTVGTDIFVGNFSQGGFNGDQFAGNSNTLKNFNWGVLNENRVFAAVTEGAAPAAAPITTAALPGSTAAQLLLSAAANMLQ